MHYIESRSILSARNGMNLYRGCQHGCIYCDSRSRCYHMDHRFEDVAVKGNGLELLELALRRKRRPCMIGTGSMSDPYTPVEGELMMTRRALAEPSLHCMACAVLSTQWARCSAEPVGKVLVHTPLTARRLGRQAGGDAGQRSHGQGR